MYEMEVIQKYMDKHDDPDCHTAIAWAAVELDMTEAELLDIYDSH